MRRKRKKNFLVLLPITLFFWTTAIFLVYFVDPGTFGAIPLFFLIIFTALLLTFSIILAHTRRGTITALAITLFLVLGYLGLGNLLNFFLLVGITLAFEIFFTKRT